MVKYQILKWRDIPVQLRLKSGRDRRSARLSQRFQKTVYRAAYRGKAINGEAFADAWTATAWHEQAGEIDEVAAALVTEFERAYSDERLDLLARNKGNDPELEE